MSYVPHTAAERQAMLARIGAESLDALFEAVPQACRFPEIGLPAPLSELEIMAELQQMSEANLDVQHLDCFLGAGAYHHFVPSVVNHILSRSEFYTAYTPYQPEISQGTLQSIFEYQSMICALTGMDVSNASHYDGATAVAEAAITALNAVRGKRNKVVVSPTVHAEYRQVLRTYLGPMGVEVVGDESLANGLPELEAKVDGTTACLIVQNPDFLGRIHDLAAVAEKVHAQGALLIVACDPISLGLLLPPGAYGADIAVGEGQSLGIPLSFGGPSLGFFTCKQELVRRTSGRLVGQTVDVDGKRAFVLTLSTREQHIRREKATSNICSNQGLNALAAALYLAALGKCGLRQVAELCYHKAHYTAQRIAQLPGYRVDAASLFFKEFVVTCPRPAEEVNEALLDEHGILGGYDLSRVYQELDRHMLVCVTEMNSVAQIDRLVDALEEIDR